MTGHRDLMTMPRVAVFTGDPAGIGPELVQKLLDRAVTLAQARILLIGQTGTIQTPPAVRWQRQAGGDNLRPLSL